MSGTTSDSMFADPTAMGLLGLAQGFGAAAMPTPYRGGVPLGAAFGMALGGLNQGIKSARENAMGAQQLQAARDVNERTRLFLDQWKRGGAPGASSAPAGGGADAPSVTYDEAINNMRLYSLDPHSGAQARAWGEIARSLTPNGGGFVGNRGGGIMPVPGADPSAAGRETAVAGAKEGVMTQAMWDRLPVETQKMLNEAGIKVGTAWRMPQPFKAGDVVGTPAQLQNPNAPPAPDPFPGWAKDFTSAENPGGDPTAKNPRSTAAGNGQFLDGTWPKVIAAVRPDLVAGKTPAQVMALRTIPELAQQATETYGRQNAAALVNAGVPVTRENVYLAHRFGPGGATALLKGNPNAPLGLVLPDAEAVIAANPDLRGKTVGQAIQQTYALLPKPAAAAPAQPQGKPSVVPASPQTTEAKTEGERLAKLPEDITRQASESNNALERIALVRKAMADATKGGIPPGFFSPALAEAAAAAKSLGIDLSAVGVKPEAVQNAQMAREALVQISGEILKRLFPQRVTNMDIKLYSDALPHYGMDPAALGTLLDQAENAAKYDVGKAQSMNAFRADKGTLHGWEPQFYQQNGYGPNFFQALQAAQKPAAEAPGATGGPPASTLKSGSITRFSNGQEWTLGPDGNPKRVR